MCASLQEAAVKDGFPALSQCPEGFLGKLQIRKSGKVELKLGDVIMDVSDGAAFSFLQVLCVCVRVCVCGGGVWGAHHIVSYYSFTINSRIWIVKL